MVLPWSAKTCNISYRSTPSRSINWILQKNQLKSSIFRLRWWATIQTSNAKRHFHKFRSHIITCSKQKNRRQNTQRPVVTPSSSINTHQPLSICHVLLRTFDGVVPSLRVSSALLFHHNVWGGWIEWWVLMIVIWGSCCFHCLDTFVGPFHASMAFKRMWLLFFVKHWC